MLKIKNLYKTFDGLKAVDDFSCSIEQGKIIGLIGPNGAGKTTLFNIITGFLECNSGEVIFNDKNILDKPSYKITSYGISRTFQDLRLINHITVLENVLLSFQNQMGENLSNIFFRNKLCVETENKNKIKAIALLKFAGIEEKANDLAGNMSYGQQKLLSIVCCLAAKPKLILLDEPVSGVQPAMIEKITEMLKQLVKEGKTIFFIEHNMDFVLKVSDRVIVMDEGKKIAEGEPAVIRNNHEILEAYLS
jgi:ABC-type branched-subunit amino acid transport system ATPase component